MTSCSQIQNSSSRAKLQGLFKKFVDWQQCATVMKGEAVTVMASCSGGNNVVVT